METIATYEEVSYNFLFKHKSMFMLTVNTDNDIIDMIKVEACFIKKDNPITYRLSFIHRDERIIYYSYLVDKVIKGITG